MFDQIPDKGTLSSSAWSALWNAAYHKYFRLWINLARSGDVSEDEAKDLVQTVITGILSEPSRHFSSLEHARNYVAKSVLNRVKGLRLRRGRRSSWED